MGINIYTSLPKNSFEEQNITVLNCNLKIYF